jgi:hypothetical protein
MAVLTPYLTPCPLRAAPPRGRGLRGWPPRGESRKRASSDPAALLRWLDPIVPGPPGADIEIEHESGRNVPGGRLEKAHAWPYSARECPDTERLPGLEIGLYRLIGRGAAEGDRDASVGERLAGGVDRPRRLPEPQSSSLITGRVGDVRATSVNPAAENIATVPVKIADPPTREALKAATSTGCPSTAVAPCSRANSTAALSSVDPTPDLRWRLSTTKQVTHQTPRSSVSTFAKALLPLTRGKSDRGPTLVHPTGSSSRYARSPGGTAAWVISCRSAVRLSGVGPETADSQVAERKKRRHQHHEGSSPRRPNTVTRSLHRSAVAERTRTDMVRSYDRARVAAELGLSVAST